MRPNSHGTEGRIAMTNPANPHSAEWRALSETEFAASAERNLGGALGVMFLGAVAMVALLVLVIAWLIAFGDFFVVAMMSRMMLSGSSMASVVGRIAMIPQAAFFVWACVFVIMTMGRRPSTPKVAS